MANFFQGQLAETDLRLLRVFHTVAEKGGFTAAEVTLGKSKSAISADVSALESRLGVTLCQRGRGGFSLTSEGGRSARRSSACWSTSIAFAIASIGPVAA
jgi:LysR family transcriptional regulator, transcriptional activator for bauABCD operon